MGCCTGVGVGGPESPPGRGTRQAPACPSLSCFLCSRVEGPQRDVRPWEHAEGTALGQEARGPLLGRQCRLVLCEGGLFSEIAREMGLP